MSFYLTTFCRTTAMESKHSRDKGSGRSPPKVEKALRKLSDSIDRTPPAVILPSSSHPAFHNGSLFSWELLYFFSVSGIFLGFCFPASLFFCFSLLLCFSAFPCFSASPFFCCFSHASLLFAACSASLLSLLFCLFCFSDFFCLFAFFAFPAFLLFCFSSLCLFPVDSRYLKHVKKPLRPTQDLPFIIPKSTPNISKNNPK